MHTHPSNAAFCSPLDQLICLVEQFEPQEYSRQLPLLSGASIGQHVRHILEFYVCLFETSPVNYDQRKRDLKLEVSPAEAVQKMEGLMTQIEECEIQSGLQLEHLMGDRMFVSESTFCRELIYLYEHSIHHFALIKIGMENYFADKECQKNFGVADSTIRYRKKQSCAY
ncbi:DinB family protein [Jiulongibacter sp. NS-SX5]|uniref:DinB family protein n=1 Tax=Jiulongibacter sp. NS-SX5 TaxID=3463854 RepID=UPI0040597489